LKAKLHSDEFGHVRHLPEEAAKAHLEAGGLEHHAPLPAGTVIDDPDAWILVQNGQAGPEDDECRKKANMTPLQIAQAKVRYKKLCLGRATGDRKYDAPDKSKEPVSLADAEHAA
jgi:hypothetical protein